MSDDVVFSVVAPVFNEIGLVEEFHRRVREVMEGLGQSWELVLVDDGSTDGSTEKILALADRDPHVRAVLFSRNFGHQLAITAGTDYSRGRAVVILDADLQDPPEVIPEMVAKWREGYEVVYGIRSVREGESWFVVTACLPRMISRITVPSLSRAISASSTVRSEAQRGCGGMGFARAGRLGGSGRRSPTAAQWAIGDKYPFRAFAWRWMRHQPLFHQIATNVSYERDQHPGSGEPSLAVGNEAFLGTATLVAVLFLEVSSSLGSWAITSVIVR
jgi:glycosyltransferase involved in cell wall biosynthesis